MRTLLIGTAAASAALIVLALAVQPFFSFIRPEAVGIGCVFAFLNLIFFKFVTAAILGAGSAHRGLIAALALLKLPLLALLILLLSHQSAEIIGNVMLGSLVFIPGALGAGLLGAAEDESPPDRDAQA